MEHLAPLAPLRQGGHLEQLAPLGDAIDVSFWDNSYSPGWFWVSIHDGRATKDLAVRMLLQPQMLL